MRLKNIFKVFFPVFLATIALHAPLTSSPLIYEAEDNYIQALASLVFHLRELQDPAEQGQSPNDTVQFSEIEIAALWQKAECHAESAAGMPSLFMLKSACGNYNQAMHDKDLGAHDEAYASFALCSDKLTRLWEAAIYDNSGDYLQPNLADAVLRKKSSDDPNVENNPYLTKSARKKMRPYLLSLYHPMRSVLDSLCKNKRITADQATFENAGFHVLITRPRSHVSVASHPEMPRYLVKVCFDTVLEEKRGKASWEWLVLRCEGAEKVRNVIRDKKIKNFTVAKKWIYCLPPRPSPPRDNLHTRHLALLLVTDMNLVSRDQNYYAWKNYITQEHLDELYKIISRAKGSSYRPDNIAYTKKGNFAFIDTEYPAEGPDFKSIRSYLNSDMRAYWDRIVVNGGS